jgi:Holliday junction resolvasome RuvABC endonuclease subunit
MTTTQLSVLGFHLSSRGFGWALFEDHLSLVDWGVFDFRASENAIALNRMETLLDEHHPGVLALERHENRRHQRIRRLCFAVVRSAERRGIAVYRYSRMEIAGSRFINGARTRQQVAAAVANCLSALRQRLPKPRQIWVGERSAMRLFCAAACALAYFDANP